MNIINKLSLDNVTVVSMKMDTAVWCGWTTQLCAQKLNTAWQVQVAGSTINLYLDVAGAHFSWALDFWEAQFGLGL